ncbi:MAG: protein phosphatase CheZ [Pseudomonadota bacterium]
MANEIQPEPETATSDADSDVTYDALLKAFHDAPRGAWFLQEHARRNRYVETAAVMERLDKLESPAASPEEQRVDYLRTELQQMAASIMEARREIASIKPNEGENNRIMAATEELDAIVSSTERATSEIIAAAERIQDLTDKLREGEANAEICDEIETHSIDIFTACSFQDITGQRTSKVIHVLRYLEARINAMVKIWGDPDQAGAADMTPRPDENADTRPDAHLLNGPQAENVAISQDEIDKMLGGDDFDAVPAPAAEADATPEPQGADAAAEPRPATAVAAEAPTPEAPALGGDAVDQDAIDALFDEAPAA